MFTPFYVFNEVLLTIIYFLQRKKDNLNSASNCCRANLVLFITQNIFDINIYIFFRIRMQSSSREHCLSF